MRNVKITRLAVAGALAAAVAAMTAAHAQMMAPIPQMTPPPERVDVYSNMPKVEPGDDPANWSPRQNVIESDRYEQLIRTSPAFRDARIRKECGSITEPDLYQQCVATFY